MADSLRLGENSAVRKYNIALTRCENAEGCPDLEVELEDANRYVLYDFEDGEGGNANVNPESRCDTCEFGVERR